MKCPKCGADSSVKDTRAYMDVFLKRTRLCFNNHRFVSFEVLAGHLQRRDMETTRKAILGQRPAEHKLKRAILEHHAGLGSGLVAELVGCSSAYVRQVRREANPL